MPLDAPSPSGPSAPLPPAAEPPTFSAILAGFVLLKLALQIPFHAAYGFHHDELYFLVCGERLDWGYVDHGPVTPALARLAGGLGGGRAHLGILRALAAWAGAGALAAALMLVRTFGGGPFALAVTGLSMLIAPAYLRMGHMFSIPSFEPLFWTGTALLTARSLARPGGSLPLWLAAGAVAGLGVLNKSTLLFGGAGLALGLAASPTTRRRFRTPGPWAGLALAAAVVLPWILWQIRNGWPTAEFLRSLNASTMSRIPRGAFLAGQILYLHPLTVPVWLGGLIWLLRARPAASFRPQAGMFLAPLAVFLATHAKVYYLAAAYPVLLAAGGVAWERRFRAWGWRRRAQGVALAARRLIPWPFPSRPWTAWRPASAAGPAAFSAMSMN